jgi:hypothetical protein
MEQRRHRWAQARREILLIAMEIVLALVRHQATDEVPAPFLMAIPFTESRS